MTFEYTPKGVCSRKMIIDVENGKVEGLQVIGGKIKDVQFYGGCNGNLQGIAHLVQGMPVDEVIERLDGIKCGSKSSSCPAQLAEALKEYKANN